MEKDFNEKYKQILGVFDVCFGVFAMTLVCLSIIFYLTGQTDLRTVLLLIGFPMLNLLSSRFTYKNPDIFRFEIFRIFLCNGLLCGAIFSYSSGVLVHCWVPTLIMCIAAGIFVLTWTGQRKYAYLQLLHWIGVLIVGNAFVAPVKMAWIQLALLCMCLVMICSTLMEVVHLLNITMARETEARGQLFHQSKLSSLGEMAGGIAHEINNPLAIISASTETIRKMFKRGKNTLEDYAELLDDVDKTIMRMTNIINGLRNLSRDSRHETFDRCKIMDCLNDVLSLCSERFRSHDIRLDLVISEELRQMEIELLRIQMSQVLLNLLSNAFDAIADLPERWVRIEVQNLGDTVRFRIEDSGAGIPKDIREQIFEPFFTTKDIGKGTGLGLSLSSTIIRNHGGWIQIDADNAHTCFVIDLPKNQKVKLKSPRKIA